MSDLKILPLFKFRALIVFHPEYKCFVARCLETGDTVTAGDVELAREMIVEVLEDAIEFAIKHNNVKNLTSSPAELSLWKQWVDAVKDGREVITKHFATERTAFGTIQSRISIVIVISHEPPHAQALTT